MPLRSMTAYGSGELNEGGKSFSCQVRTLNSRFTEVSVKLPRFLLALETEVINAVKKRLDRGKVDVFFTVRLPSQAENLPNLNAQALDHYVKLMQQISASLSKSHYPDQSVARMPGPYELIRLEGILDMGHTGAAEADSLSEVHRESVLACLEVALEKIDEERLREGSALNAALHDLLKDLGTDCSELETLAPQLMASVYSQYLRRLENLLKKIKDAGLPGTSELSTDRLHLEIGILTDKSDIQEELTRLRVHYAEFAACLNAQTPIGRKLDFLCQELHREVNTISNKLVQTEAAQISLRMKQTVERLRQQIQNIE